MLKFFQTLYSRFRLLPLWQNGVWTIVAVILIGYIFCMPRPLFHVPYSTIVSDRRGELLGARIAVDGQWRFPPADSVPDKYAQCLIAFEDRNFRHHNGVNPLAIARAFVQNIKAGKIVSGGSTITMQTVRLMRNNRRTVLEKLMEMVISTRLEWSFSKDRILALYASHAPMGGNVVGIDAASWRYFGHTASSLSWAEAATLAVLPNAPALLHFGRNRDVLTAKRNRLLKYLHKKKIIADTDYTLAIEEPLPAYPHALPQDAPHLVTQIWLQQPGTNAKSTIDKRLQEQTDEVLSRWNAEFSQNGVFNLAAMIVDIQTNEVLAYSGNVHFNRDNASNQVDIIRSPRSTGSILKPFLYCAIQQEGSLLPNELLPDIPVNIGGFAPKNFSLRYDGAVPANEALARSLNIPSVVALRKFGVQKFHQLLRRAGFTTITKPAEHYGLSLILGGAEGTLWDIANAYADMARSVNDFNASSSYFKPQPFSILEKERKTEREKTSDPLFRAGAAWLTLEALTNVNRPEEIDWRFIPSMQKVAWKTGTSYGFRDAWAVGVTPRYLVAVWTGNASGEGRPGLTGAQTAAQVMFDLFNLVPSSPWFQTPYGDLREVVVCRESGCLKSINCPESSADTVLVSPKGLQGNVCSYHRKIHVSEDGRYRVFEECAGTRGIVADYRFILPPSQEWYYKQLHPDYQSLPPFSPECLAGASGQTMQFIYPYPNAVIKPAKQMDGSAGKVVFELAHRNPSMKVFWHLDNDYLGESSDVHRMELSPAKGEHRVTVVDESGNSVAIRFRVD